MVAQTVVEVGIHDIPDAVEHVVVVYIAPDDGDLRHADNVGEVFLFVAERLGYDKGDIHVATLPHTLSETVAGSSETAEDVRWEFPPEH